MSNVSRYEQDFYGWAIEQAALLRGGRLSEADFENIAEELDALGRSEKRELVSRLGVLLMHLLKWDAQPVFRGTSWRLTIEEQRRRLHRLLRDNPSFRRLLPESVIDAYGDAIISAARETGNKKQSFPALCPFSLDQIFDDAFTPGDELEQNSG